MKKCSICEVEKPYSAFHKHKSKDGYMHMCKQCNSLIVKLGSAEKARDKLLSDKLDKTCGGYKIYILNHPKDNERKFNIVSTKGNVWNFDSKQMFLDKLEHLLNVA